MRLKSGTATGLKPDGTFTTPNTIASTVVVTMPARMAPRTFRAVNTPMSSSPNTASSTCGSARLPSSITVSKWAGVPLPLAATSFSSVGGMSDSLIVIKPDSFSPMIVINRPMPAVMAYFSEAGIPSTSSWRTRVTVKAMKTKPDMNTAPSAVCHGTPMPITTVKA